MTRARNRSETPQRTAVSSEDRQMLARVLQTLKGFDAVAKACQLRVESLLAYLEPPAGLRSAAPGTALVAILAQEALYPQVVEALAKVQTPGKLEAVAQQRHALQLFLEKLSRIPPRDRVLQKAALEDEMGSILRAWPDLIPDLRGAGLTRLEHICVTVL